MTAPEYRQDDVLGQGYCPRCYRAITLDTSLHGVCTVHGKVPADFARPAGWLDPDEDDEGRYGTVDPATDPRPDPRTHPEYWTE